MVQVKSVEERNLPSGLFDWRVEKPLDHDGVIVGCNGSHEWMLPWWWVNFRLHNDYPVTFFDFGGMTESAKSWCKARGQLVTLEIPVDLFLAKREAVSETVKPSWEGDKGSDVWEARPNWFKKPFACLHSPYKRTLWIDLDCQVRKPVADLFDYCDNRLGISVAREPDEIIKFYFEEGRIFADEIEYNTGVVAFKHGSVLIVDWAKECVEKNHYLRGDQEVLTRLFYEKKITPFALLPEYNSRWHGGLSADTVIIHWLGAGKGEIRNQIHALQSMALMDLSI